jgi:hypothetical protein
LARRSYFSEFEIDFCFGALWDFGHKLIERAKQPAAFLLAQASNSEFIHCIPGQFHSLELLAGRLRHSTPYSYHTAIHWVL